MKAIPSPLCECRETIRALIDENTALRRSGAAFGELAERLSQQLQLERRERLRLAEQNLAPPPLDSRSYAPLVGPAEQVFPGKPSFGWANSRQSRYAVMAS